MREFTAFHVAQVDVDLTRSPVLSLLETQGRHLQIPVDDRRLRLHRPVRKTLLATFFLLSEK